MSEENYTFAVAVNNNETLRKNLFLSPGFQEDHKHQVLIKENYPSASLAYNSAIDEAENEIIIFIHQDIYLPETWFSDLSRCLSYLEERQVNWGVLGCFGSRKDADGGLGRVYTTGLGLHGNKLNEPEPVETLDEIILIIRKSSELRFDPSLPHFHLYGTDLCMLAKDSGMTNFAFQGFCIHNTNQLLSLPKEFYDCYYYLKRKWAKFLPMYTSCLTISRFDKELYQKKIRELFVKALGKRKVPLHRINDPRSVLYEKVQKI
jgi:glycosyltransferase involved in cell wall biosynthesis